MKGIGGEIVKHVNQLSFMGLGSFKKHKHNL